MFLESLEAVRMPAMEARRGVGDGAKMDQELPPVSDSGAGS